ncbi:hypothetical protein [Shewanella sp. GXUN23E]|uniref:hypothetical protein n=1 Tax=Shewanella sp. GXUN23E TaxID=3422498 RepID=UPI003D7C8062
MLWQTLTFSQHCYLVATLGMLLVLFSTGEFSGIAAFILPLIALAGISVEFWPKFLKTWESLPGRALILLFYAIVANFALGSASGLVNEVSGVSAGNMPYSHNFALLLNLPGWFFMTTLLALLCWQLIVPFYLMLLLLLKLFGMHGLWHPPHYRFVFTTALVRYLWSSILMFQLLSFGLMTGLANNSMVDLKTYQELAQELNEADSQDPGSGTPTEADDVEAKLAGNEQDIEDVSLRAKRYHFGQQKLLAWFIWHFEADSYSRCRHEQDSRVIELNDYEILQIVRLKEYDKQTGTGYDYRVLPCISPALGHEFLPSTTTP